MLIDSIKFLYSSDNIQLHFDVGSEIAISRLKSKVSRSQYSILAGQGMIGKVTTNHIKIWRFSLERNRNTTPRLHGKFFDLSEGSKFVGQLKLSIVIRIFFSFLFVLFSVVTLIGLLAVVTGAPSALPLVAVGPLFILIICWIIRVAKYQLGEDHDWLIENISSAVSNELSNPS